MGRRTSLGRRNKTDRIDAALIASFGTTRALPDWQPADPALQRLRELLRRLADLQSLLRAERNRAAAAAGVLVSKSLARMTRALEKEIERIESRSPPTSRPRPISTLTSSAFARSKASANAPPRRRRGQAGDGGRASPAGSAPKSRATCPTAAPPPHGSL